jgi:uncharacterized OsmC-like protein
MKSEELRSLQKPLKEKYKESPEQALITLKAEGSLHDSAIQCNVETGRAIAAAGLHPATGGDGSLICSGDMLLQALVACSGVTLRAVAVAIEVQIIEGKLIAEGDIDFRGTLAVEKDAEVGFKKIRLTYELKTNASREMIEKLLKLTERYCVVFQTLKGGVELQTSFKIII